jgi:hypothetical protein
MEVPLPLNTQKVMILMTSRLQRTQVAEEVGEREDLADSVDHLPASAVRVATGPVVSVVPELAIRVRTEIQLTQAVAVTPDLRETLGLTVTRGA